jgi:ABC-type transport system substrate-binding protein
VFGFFNLRKAGSPWHDVRLRQAVNYAINREDLIRYATKGNGMLIPALVPEQGFGDDLDLAPYSFDPATARRLLREVGFAEGLALSLIASEELQVQATVVSKMLELAGLTVGLQILDGTAFNRKTHLGNLEQPPEDQLWDIALMAYTDVLNFPVFQIYRQYALDGPWNWGIVGDKLPNSMTRCYTRWTWSSSRRSSARWNGTRMTRRIFSFCTIPFSSTR